MLIALAGYKGSGKDTAAKYLVDKYKYEQTSFARKLKFICSELFNKELDYWETDKEELQPDLFGKSKREIMQTVGQNMRETISRYVWINAYQKHYNLISPQSHTHRKVVCSDLRYIEELEYMTNMKATIIYVEKDLEKTDDHISESFGEAIKTKADYIICNNFSYDYLFGEIDKIIQKERNGSIGLYSIDNLNATLVC